MTVTPRSHRPRVLMLVENISVPRDRRAWQEAQTLTEAGFDVSIISPTGPPHDTSEQATIDGISIRRYPERAAPSTAGPWGYIGEYTHALRHMRRLARELDAATRFDLVHLCNPPDVLYLAIRSLRHRGARVVFDHHDLVPELFEVRFGTRRGPLYHGARAVERRTLHLADVVIASNESYRQIAIERGAKRPDEVFVVRMAPNLERFRLVEPDPALRRGRQYLLAYAGTIGPQDGLDHALRALRLLAQRRDDWHAIIAGDGDSAQAMRRLATDLGISERVEFVGFLGDTELVRLLSTADVCLSPEPSNSLNDVSTMIKVVEYMALARPIVAFDLPETRFSAGEAALYAKPNDDESFAACVEQLLDDAGRRESMGVVGRHRVEADLSWSRSKEQLLAAYERALASKGAVRSRVSR